MPDGMLGSGLSPIIDLLVRFILRFKPLLVLYPPYAHDLASQFGRRTPPPVHTPLTNPRLANSIVLFSVLVVLSHILKHLARRTDITVFLFVVPEMTLAKGLLLLAMQCLALRGNHHLNSLRVDFL